MLKLLLFYNLVIISLIEIFSLKAIDSVPGIIFPLLLLPVGLHLGTELVHQPPRPRGKRTLAVTMFKTIAPKVDRQPIEGQVISDRDRRLFLIPCLPHGPC